MDNFTYDLFIIMASKYKLRGDYQSYLLHKEGILVGLTASGSLHSQRNLPFLAGTAAGYGLSKSDALKMITYNNAKILGIDNITGSLEVGKDANIIVSEGDILDMRSSKIEMAFIKGKKINLNGKQQILYDRFKRWRRDN